MHTQVHPDLSKADKKRLCGILECQRLTPEVRAHAVKNEFLPLRTVVQLLYFEQEKDSMETTSSKLQKSHDLLLGAKKRPATRDGHGKRSLINKEEFNREEVTRRTSHAEDREKGQHKAKQSDAKLALDLERKMVIREDSEEIGSEKLRVAKEGRMSSSKLDLDSKNNIQRARSKKSEHGRQKGR